MANITFSIGSVFQGEGFKKAQQAINETTSNVKKATGITNQLVSTLGMMDSKFSQATNAITGMISAIANGNPILIAMQVAMTGIALYQKHAQDEADKLKQKMEELSEKVKLAHEALVKTFNDETKAQFDKAISDCQKLGDEFDKLTNNINQSVAAINKLDATRDIGKNLDFKINRALAENNGATKVDLAKMDKAQVDVENTQRIKYAEEKLEAAIKARADNNDKANNIEEQINTLLANNEQLQNKLNDYGELDEQIKKETTSLLEQNKKEIDKLIKQKEKTIESDSKLDADIKQVKIELINTEKQNRLYKLEADRKIKEAYDEEAKLLIEKNQKEEEAQKKKEEQDKKLQDLNQKEIDIREEKVKKLEDEKKTLEEKAETEKKKIVDDKNKDYQNTKNLIGGSGGGSDGSYYDSNGGLHLTSNQRNNNLWNSATTGVLGDLRSGLMNYAQQGIKGSNAKLNSDLRNYVNSAEFANKYRTKDMSNKDWNNYKKDVLKAGRNLAHSGKYNDLSQSGGGTGGIQDENAIQITSPALDEINTKIETIKSKLDELGLK